MQRPPYNALTPEFCRELSQVLAAASSNPEIRAILLESSASAFCVGADLKWAQSTPQSALSELVRAMNQVCEILYTCRKPVLTAVGGSAAGGGLAIALAGDVRLASVKATFRIAYPQVALCLDGGSSFRLVQLAGMSKTQELVFDDRSFNATEARTLGLIQEAIHPDRFEEKVLQRLEALANGPTLAWAETKALLNPPDVVHERLEREAEAIERLTRTVDVHAAIEAFLEKRTPQFQGR